MSVAFLKARQYGETNLFVVPYQAKEPLMVSVLRAFVFTAVYFVWLNPSRALRFKSTQKARRRFLEHMARSRHVPDQALAWLLNVHVWHYDIGKRADQLREFMQIALDRPSIGPAITALPTRRRSAPAEHSGVHLVPTSSVIPLDSRTGSHRKHSQTAHRS